MSPQKVYLEDPAVRVELSRVRFPKVCPVCGEPASVRSRITISAGGTNWEDPSFRAQPISMKRSSRPTPKYLPIFVCEDHYYADDSEERYKSCCIIIDGFAMAFFFFGLLFLGDSFYRGRPIPFWSMVFSTSFAVSLFLTWIAFRPNAIQRAVKIVGFDPGMQNILIIFKDKSYRDMIMQENPMATELVSWIVKPGS